MTKENRKFDRLLIPSFGIRRIGNLPAFLHEAHKIVFFGPADAIAGWGKKPTGLRARSIANKRGLPYISIEDGFLRSFGLGVDGAMPLSLVVDCSGIYYDSMQASDLETRIEEGNFSGPEIARAKTAMGWIRHEKLSKYNKGLIPYDGAPIKRLIIDQTAGDASVVFSGAEDNAFEKMIDDALQSFDAVSVAVKLHPDTLTGKKGGYMRELAAQKGVRLITTPVNPWDILAATDEVATISSQFGFEALMGGKKVHCYGLPFYAGWGLTEDRVQCARRNRKATAEEIFAAAYIDYTRYVDPYSGQASTLENTIGILSDIVRHEKRMAGSFSAVGFSLWKRWFIPKFVPRVSFSRFDGKKLIWASKDRESRDVVRMEDGFVRSRGLGAFLARPWSLVIDDLGIFYDPRHASRLEKILQESVMPEGLLQRAARLRKKLTDSKVSKYNVGKEALAPFDAGGKKVILVPGQVEDDASILTGTRDIRTNLDLLKAVREKNPEAYILYKPHPDVEARRRKGRVDDAIALQYCDRILRSVSIASLWPLVDEVHSLTSLAGFEALLRDKKVFAYGNPFYAGWGLTQDQYVIGRRSRKLSIDELVAGTLVLYPFYFDWKTGNICNIETVINRLSRKAAA